MREFNYEHLAQLNEQHPQLQELLTQIYQLRDSTQKLLARANPEQLDQLTQQARLESVRDSNRIEQIYAADSRLSAIVQNQQEPQTLAEAEIAGYREAYDCNSMYCEIVSLIPNYILQLHSTLMQFTGMQGGVYKAFDNSINATKADGSSEVIFRPLPALLTRAAIEDICAEYNMHDLEKTVDPLILIPVFIHDFLCIHPFSDGNGRTSRLLTQLLLLQNRHKLVEYVSLETIMLESIADYYTALSASSANWLENGNDELPFVEYFLKLMLQAYKQFEQRLLSLNSDSQD